MKKQARQERQYQWAVTVFGNGWAETYAVPASNEYEAAALAEAQVTRSFHPAETNYQMRRIG